MVETTAGQQVIPNLTYRDLGRTASQNYKIISIAIEKYRWLWA